MTATVAPPARRGLLTAIAGTDHKSIATRTIVTALLFFLAGGVLALLMRTELARPGMQVVSHSGYDELFSMHGSTMIYLFVTPIALALGVYFVPLQVGARRIAGPRWALVGWWLLVFGGLVMWAGFLTATGAAKSGWIAIDPLSDTPFSPGIGTDFWIYGVILAVSGQIIHAACVLATIVAHRTRGMTMLRLPVFTWSMVVTCLMVLTAFPVLIVAMVLLWVQRKYGGVFDSPGGPATYQQLFWFYGHPVVYVMFFPFVGAVAEVIAVFSGKRFFGYKPLVVSLLAFAALSMSVWAHHMFTTDQVENRYFALTSTALLVPAGIEYFDFLATMWRGRIWLATPMLFALGFAIQFLIGGLTGIFVASPPLDYHVHDSYFVVAHFHYTLFAGSAFGLFAAFYYWFPKVTGRMLGERLGKVHFWLLVVGTNMTFLPMFWLGADGMPRRVANYSPSDGWTGVNSFETAGSYVIALAMLAFAWNLVVSLRRRVRAPADPWQGHTLEWATPSPPPPENFLETPPVPVRSHAPLLDARLEAGT